MYFCFFLSGAPWDFQLGGQLVTQSLTLSPGTHTLVFFSTWIKCAFALTLTGSWIPSYESQEPGGFRPCLGRANPPAWNQSSDRRASRTCRWNVVYARGGYFWHLQVFSQSHFPLNHYLGGWGLKRTWRENSNNSFDLLLMISPLCFQMFKNLLFGVKWKWYSLNFTCSVNKRRPSLDSTFW